MQSEKKVPQWVLTKKSLSQDHEVPLVFVGAEKSNIVTEGKLPNGDTYQWKKRRK